MTVQFFLLGVDLFNFVIKGDVTIMHHIIDEISFNVLATMIKVIQEVASRAKLALPYSIFLTLVFKAFGINLDGEPSRRLQHFDTYNNKSLLRMGYLKANGQWIRKVGEIEEAERERDRERSEPMKQEEHGTFMAQPA